MKALLIISLCCLPTPCFGVGVAGLIAWGLLSLLFAVAGQGSDQMTEEIQQGNTGQGKLWLFLVFVVVILGGVAVLGSFLSVAASLRGVQL